MPAKRKTGKGPDDIFGATATTTAAKPSPPEPEEQWQKVTVLLYPRHTEFLDRLALELRGKTKQPVRRAELIRALVDALESGGVDVVGAVAADTASDKIEEAVRAVLTECLKTGMQE
jgi:hypothetical protein